MNAVILLGSTQTLEEVKEALLLDEEILRSYVKRQQEGGVSELLKAIYQGSTLYLFVAQLEKLCKELQNKIYLTTQSVIDYVKQNFGVSYTQSGMRDLLHRRHVVRLSAAKSESYRQAVGVKGLICMAQ